MACEEDLQLTSNSIFQVTEGFVGYLKDKVVPEREGEEGEDEDEEDDDEEADVSDIRAESIVRIRNTHTFLKSRTFNFLRGWCCTISTF